MQIAARWLRQKLLTGACLLAAGLPQAAEKTIAIGVAEFPPFKYLSASQKVIGSDTEVVEQVFQRMGYQPQIQMAPWARVQKLAEAGQFAAIYTFTRNADREKNYYFSDPISTVKDVFYYNTKMGKRQWRSLDDLKGLRVGASAGYSYHPIFRYAVENHTFSVVEEVFQSPPELLNLRKLAMERIDLFICEVSVCQYYIKANAKELKGLDYLDKVIGDARTFHVGFPKAYPGAEQLASHFNAELAKFVKEGRRKPIFAKYNIVSDLK